MRDLSRRIVTREYAERNPFDPKTGPANRIVVPTEEERASLLARLTGVGAHQLERLCGHCRNFNLQLGQQEYVCEQRVFEVAFNELEHDPLWYGRTDMFGACMAYEGHMSHAMAPAKVPLHYYDSSVPYERKDTPTDCVDFTPRKPGERASRIHFVGQRRNYEE